MERRIIMVDSKKCTGCRICEVVCSFHHEGIFSPSLASIWVVKNEPEGMYTPIVCVQCTRPVCIEVCPEGAIFRSPFGVIIVDESKCTGCRACLDACPFAAVGFHPTKEVALICDLCNGEPLCVANCIPKALTYGPVSELLKRKRWAVAELKASEEGT